MDNQGREHEARLADGTDEAQCWRPLANQAQEKEVMPFENDKVISEALCQGEKDTTIILQVVSRAGGPLKMQISRFTLANGERVWKKLGRLSITEAFLVQDRLAVLLKHYKEPEHDPVVNTDNAD